MIKTFTLTLLCLVTFARADETVLRTLETTASPLQCWRALCEDWIYKQWAPVQSVAFGGAPDTPWRITYPDGTLEEGILKILEPGHVLEYTFLGEYEIETVHLEFIPRETGTTIKLSHLIPGHDGRTLKAAMNAGSRWEARLLYLKAYLDSRPNTYLTKPLGDGRYPAVLLLHDRFGLNNTVRDLADSLSQRGYVVIAVDMFRGDRTSDVTQARQFLELVQEQNALSAVGSAWRALLADSSVNKSRIGVVGLGYGGEMAMRVLAADPSFRAGVAWYPATAPADSVLLRIAAPLMIIHAAPAMDKPTLQAEAMSQALVQQGVRAETVLIKGDVGFAESANGAAYSGSASTDAFRTTMGFLDRRLKL